MKCTHGQTPHAVFTTSSWVSCGSSSMETLRSSTTERVKGAASTSNPAAFLAKSCTRSRVIFWIKVKRRSVPSTGSGRSACTSSTQQHSKQTRKTTRKDLRRKKAAKRAAVTVRTSLPLQLQTQWRWFLAASCCGGSHPDHPTLHRCTVSPPLRCSWMNCIRRWRERFLRLTADSDQTFEPWRTGTLTEPARRRRDWRKNKELLVKTALRLMKSGRPGGSSRGRTPTPAHRTGSSLEGTGTGSTACCRTFTDTHDILCVNQQ